MRYRKILYCAEWIWGVFVFGWLGFEIWQYSVPLAVLSFVVAAAGAVILIATWPHALIRDANEKTGKWKIVLWTVSAAILILLLKYGFDMGFVIVFGIAILLSVAAETVRLRTKTA